MENTGSLDWFKEKSKEPKYIKLQKEIENLRKEFLDRFAPDKLNEMSGEELLEQVFDNNDKSMMYLITVDEIYKIFGSTGNIKFLSILYKTNGDDSWNYKNGSNAEAISINNEVAKAKAIEIRDLLVKAIDIIKSKKLNSIDDYIELNKDLSSSNIYFYKYNWVIKYYQMVFPYYFPGMYADGQNKGSLKTLDRALSILGIDSKLKDSRIEKAGKISLFIRNCDINNIVFNEIYADNWGWHENPMPIAQSIKHNNNKCVASNIKTVNKEPYYISLTKDEIKRIINDIDSSNLKGDEKEALTKIRVNQGVFRKNLINRYGMCCVCGINDENLLIASHIKPWSDSKPEEKLDTDNGFLLCPDHDKLFDKGYISFYDNGSMLISKVLKDQDKKLLNISDDIKIEITNNNKKYLKYHREHIFKGE